jgi:hypothetical protein
VDLDDRAAMPDLDFLVHLPLLRIEEPVLPFGPGKLYRMPFDHYNQVTLGAFEEQRAKYEATEPVFLSFSVPVDEDLLQPRGDDAKGVTEIKMPSTRTAMLDQLGLGVINWVHDRLVTPAWSSLLLAAPATALAPPRWSQTFLGFPEGFTLRLGPQPTLAVRVQGQADHEYLFLADAVSQPIPSDAVALAAALLLQLRDWEQVPELRAALASLRATGVPLLSRQDRVTIAVQALEFLLLPDVHTTLKKTFSRRVSALLTSAGQPTAPLSAVAADLYALRSESVHGARVTSDTEAAERYYAEQILAAAIRTAGGLHASGRSLEQVRAEIDSGAPIGNPTGFELESSPIGRASRFRLAPERAIDHVFSATSSMTGPDGHVVCWSPLIGLATEAEGDAGSVPIGTPPATVVMSMTPQELFDLEERDIRRDFLAEFVMHGHPMAVLATMPATDGPATAEETLPGLERLRDLSVVTLRVAGFDRFLDPELFGSAAYEGLRRIRRPTVLRQTVAEQLRHEAGQRISAADRLRLDEIWREVSACDSGERSPRIEHVFSLFRRSFDRIFLDQEQRALILISLVEAMVGPFRARTDPVQLEDLIAVLSKRAADVAWFRAEGRTFRNAVAHGEFRPETEAEEGPAALESLQRLASDVLLEFIRTWNAADAGSRRAGPQALLTAKATRSFT